jgi:hypothetical protein
MELRQNNLLDVCPAVARHDLADRTLANAKLGGDFALLHSIGCQSSNFSDDSLIEFGQLRQLPNRVVISAFVPHISHVVFGGTREQVLGIDAEFNVAFVANQNVVGDRSICQNVRQSVCSDFPLSLLSKADRTITVGSFASSPEDTSIPIGFRKESAESNSNWFNPSRVIARIRAVVSLGRTKLLDQKSISTLITGLFHNFTGHLASFVVVMVSQLDNEVNITMQLERA